MFTKNIFIIFLFYLFIDFVNTQNDGTKNVDENEKINEDVTENATEDNGGIIFQKFDTPQLLPDGRQTYKFSFETEGSIKREERGEADSKNGISIIGTYTYLKPDNTIQKVFYTAGSKGFVLIPEKVFLRYRGRQRIPAPALASLAG
ncbi:uncharacterized protein [Onthophagus taurus]|uniref:uncharacterized protein n=1 Tax=Onthophagus taurus TaxID=166361 RepID=UPI000C204142|nr:uncharacterized protein LOC111424088 [Onthophagus taurus]